MALATEDVPALPDAVWYNISTNASEDNAFAAELNHNFY